MLSQNDKVLEMKDQKTTDEIFKNLPQAEQARIMNKAIHAIQTDPKIREEFLQGLVPALTERIMQKSDV